MLEEIILIIFMFLRLKYGSPMDMGTLIQNEEPQTGIYLKHAFQTEACIYD